MVNFTGSMSCIGKSNCSAIRGFRKLHVAPESMRTGLDEMDHFNRIGLPIFIPGIVKSSSMLQKGSSTTVVSS